MRKQVCIVPFSHLDLTFMGTHEECLSRGNKVISLALELAREDPDFRYLLEYALPVDVYLQCHPEQADELRRLIAEGRIELCSSWSGIYQNSSEDEDLVRNATLAIAYARKTFGVVPDTMELTDLPGSTPQYPQLLSKLGIKHAVITRCAPKGVPLFYWRSPDGSQVLAYHTSGYGWAGGLGCQVSTEEMARRGFRQVVEAAWQQCPLPLLRHYGSDMHLPPQRLTRVAREWNAANDDIEVTVTTPSAYFASLEVPADTPALSGDMPSTWAYVLAAHAQVSALDSAATNLLLAAEKWATISSTLGYRQYPREQLGAAWSTLLYAKDHNFGGRGSRGGQLRKLEQRQQVCTAASDIIRDSLRLIAEKVQVPRESIPLVVFNALAWERAEPVEAHVTFYPGPLGDRGGADILQRGAPFVLVDDSGASVPYQITADRRHTLGEMDLVFLAGGIPSLGYRTYRIEPAPEEPVLPLAVRRKDNLWFRTEPRELVVESDLFRLAVDRATGRVRVFDRTLGAQILEDISVFGVTETDDVMESPSRGLSTDDPAHEERIEARVDAVELIENGPVRAVVQLEETVMGIPVQQQLALYRGVRRIDLTTVVDWRVDQWGRIEQRFAFGLQDPRVTYGVPFGACDFADLLPGSGPVRGDESPEDTWKITREMDKWLDVADGRWGVTLASDHRHFRLQGSTVEKCLVRGGRMSGADDPHVRLVFRYSLAPHDGAWRRSMAFRKGWEAVNPLWLYMVNDTVAPKHLPARQSFCTIDADNVVVTAVKRADGDESVVVRGYEAEGRAASAAIDLWPGVQECSEVDLLEENPQQADPRRLHFAPWEVKTLKLRWKA